MPKTFITENDIQDLHARGTRQLSVNDEVVLTDLAYERALKLGVELKRGAAGTSTAPAKATAPDAELARRVKAAVLARLGGTVDEKLLDAVIARVLAGV